jgi:hypothetical protein
MSKQNKKANVASRNPAVYINSKFWNDYNEYANPTDKKKDKNLLFQRMVDLFMFSLVHGFKEGLREKLSPKSGGTKDIFKWSNFKEEDEVLIKAIAILDTSGKGKEEQPEIINSKKRLLEIAQEYSNGGFLDLMKKLKIDPDFEANVINLLTKDFEENS